MAIVDVGFSIGDPAWEDLKSKLAKRKWVVRLPTEAEWEKADGWDASAKRAREWPWGDEWDASQCNTWEGGIRDTTVVGMFPGGISPCGALDMAGNVFEWCSSLYKGYPYQADDDQEDPEEEGSRVLRGGAFYDLRDIARCAYRLSFLPNDRSDFVGVRVVMAPALQPSDF